MSTIVMKSKSSHYNLSAQTRKPARPPKPKSTHFTLPPRRTSTVATKLVNDKSQLLTHNRPFYANPTKPDKALRENSTLMPPLLSSPSSNSSMCATWSLQDDPNCPSSTMDDLHVPDPYSLISTVLTAIPVGIIIFIIVAGNALVIGAVLRDSRLKRQVQNWLIVSVAAADLFVGLLIMPLTLTYELLDEWALGTVLCELWLALDVLFVTASILNLCAISLGK